MSLINIHAKTLNKMLANQIQQCILRIMHSDHVGLIPKINDFFLTKLEQIILKFYGITEVLEQSRQSSRRLEVSISNCASNLQ